jgi:hypothetical protein
MHIIMQTEMCTDLSRVLGQESASYEIVEKGKYLLH